MATIVTSKQPWHKQPVGSFDLNWNNVLTQDLQITTCKELAFTQNKQFISPTSSNIGFGSCTLGEGYRSSGASSQYVRYDTGYTITGTSECTQEYLLVGSSYPSLSALGGLSTGSLTNGALNASPDSGYYGELRSCLAFNGASNPYNIHGWYGNIDIASGIAFQLNAPQHIVITKAAGVSSVEIKIYRNGDLIYTATSNNTTTNFNTSGPYFYLFGRHYSGTATITGVTVKTALYDRALSASEVRELYNNPWQVYKKFNRVYFLTSSGTTLIVSDAANGQTLDNIVLSQNHLLTIANATNAETLDNIALAQLQLLTLTDTAHTNSTDNILLSQNHLISLSDIINNDTLDNISLSQLHLLTLSDATNSENIDNIALTQNYTLTPSVISNDNTLENVVLASGYTITVDSALLSNTTDNILLSQVNLLVVTDTSSSTVTDPIQLVENFTLGVNNSQHSNIVDPVTIIQNGQLAISNVSNSQAIDNISLSPSTVLALQNILNSAVTDSPILNQQYTIIVSSALHSYLVNNITISNGTFIFSSDRLILLTSRDRTVFVLSEDSRLLIKGTNK